jgi:EmrB/QacA subfamily drug resistance transporter
MTTLGAAGATGAPAARVAGPRLPHARVTAIVYAVSMFMTIMDTQIVNVALPTLSRSFHVTTATVQWVVTAYLMSMAVLVPASGWLGDRLGSKRVYLAAIVVFTGASALCATSVSFPELVAMRVLQGAGGGMMVPVGMTMLYRAYPPEARVGVARLITRVMVIAPATAPMIGGALVTWASWRWIFTINVPVGLAVAGFGLLLAEHREPGAGRFDLSGAVLGGAGLGLLLYAVGAGPTDGWGSPAILGTGMAAVACLAGFGHLELRRAQPMLELRILSDRLFRWCSVANVFSTMAFFGSLVFVALFLQEARGVSPLDSGLTTFPEAVAIGLATGPVARAFRRIGPRRVMLAGFAILAVAAALLGRMGLSESLWEVRGLCFLLGCGVACIMLSTQAAAFAQISSSATGHASAIFNTLNRAAMSMGVALLSTVLALAGGDVLHGRAPAAAYHWVFATTLLLAVVGAVVTLWIRDADAAPAMAGEGEPVLELEA